jgi:hypothetical protein
VTTADQLLRDAQMRLECVLSCLTFRVEDPQAIELARISVLRALADVRDARARLDVPHRWTGDDGGGVVLDPTGRTAPR